MAGADVGQPRRSSLFPQDDILFSIMPPSFRSVNLNWHYVEK